jgi:hypothetical protein
MKAQKSQNRKSNRGSTSESSRSMMEPLETRRMMSVVPLGATIPVGGTTFAARPELGGVVIRDALIPVNVTDSGGTVLFKGNLQDRVVRENVTGTLDFYQTLRADTTMPMRAFLEDARRINFGGVITDMDYRTDGLGNPADHPWTASHPTPALIDFNFGPNHAVIAPGDMTLFYFCRTNATTYDVNGKTDLSFLSPASGLPAYALLTTAEPIAPQTPPSHPGEPNQPTDIVGTVWGDKNHNGAIDVSESGLGNWTVYLDLNHNGVLDATDVATLTDSSGMYQFIGMPAGNYTVRVQQKPGYANTTPLAGNVTLGPSQTVNGPDFGEVRPAGTQMDFGMLLSAAQSYGHEGTFANGDVNGDGRVDFADVLLIAQNYGHTLPDTTAL